MSPLSDLSCKMEVAGCPLAKGHRRNIAGLGVETSFLSGIMVAVAGIQNCLLVSDVTIGLQPFKPTNISRTSFVAATSNCNLEGFAFFPRPCEGYDNLTNDYYTLYKSLMHHHLTHGP
eukprot:s2607_g9.t1